MEYIDSAQAAKLLGVTTNHVGWLGAQGLLVVEHHDGKRLVPRRSLDDLLAGRARWVTLPAAGRMLGQIGGRMARQGRLVQRDTTGKRLPSIDRASVDSSKADRATRSPTPTRDAADS